MGEISKVDRAKKFAIDRLTELKEYWEADAAYDYDVSQQADCEALEIALNIMNYGTVCNTDCEHCDWVTCLLEEDKEKEKTDGKKEETGDFSEGEESSDSDSGSDEIGRNQDIIF